MESTSSEAAGLRLVHPAATMRHHSQQAGASGANPACRSNYNSIRTPAKAVRETGLFLFAQF